LGCGAGYVIAQDNSCLLARNFLEVSARLSRTFGPEDGNLDEVTGGGSSQTVLFSNKEWIEIPFAREDVVAEVREGIIWEE